VIPTIGDGAAVQAADSSKGTASQKGAASSEPAAVATEDLQIGVVYSRAELKDEPNTDAILGTEADEKDLRAYYREVREQLGEFISMGEEELAYREKHGGAALNAVDEMDWQEWQRVFKEVKASRHLLARSMVQHWRGVMEEHGKKYKEAVKDLDDDHARLARIRKAEKDTERAVRLTKLVLKVHEYAELAQNSAGVLVSAGTTALDAAAVAAATFASQQIDGMSELIVQGVQNLADYYLQLAVVSEGVASVQELLDRIKATTETLQNEATMLSYARSMASRAKKQGVD
jgi:hypothetical protein